MKLQNISIKIVIITSVIFLLQKLFPFITNEFVLISSLAFQKPWILITSIFLHSSLIHLLFNMLALFLFGSILERHIGYKKFLILYFVSGLAGSLISIPFYSAVLGASGAVFGILGVLTILKPHMVVWIYGIPARLWIATIIYVIIDLIGVIFPHGIANLAHLAGLVIGLLYGLSLRRPSKKTQKQEYNLDEDIIRDWEDKFM